MLVKLRAARRPFSVADRTFGSDIPRVIDAIDAFCEGKHPLFADVVAPGLQIPPERTWLGLYSRDDGSFTLVSNPTGADPRQGGRSSRRAVPALRLEAMLGELQGELGSLPRVSAVQDDYEWWRSHGYAPSSGKPLWLTLRETHAAGGTSSSMTISMQSPDSIVAVRMRRSRTGHSPRSPAGRRWSCMAAC